MSTRTEVAAKSVRSAPSMLRDGSLSSGVHDLTEERLRALSPDLVEYGFPLTDKWYVAAMISDADEGISMHPQSADHVDYLAWRYRIQIEERLRPACNPRNAGRLLRYHQTLRRSGGEAPWVGALSVDMRERFARSLDCGRYAPFGEVETNVELLGLFAGADRVGISDLIARYARHRDRPWWTNDHRLSTIGELLHRGIQLGLVVQEGPDTWWMPDMTMQWQLHKGQPCRVRGLPSAEQRCMDEELSNLAARRRRRDRRHAEKVGPDIRRALLTAIGRDQDAKLPIEWALFVPSQIYRDWPRLSDALGLLLDLHHDWPMNRQVTWLRRIQLYAGIRQALILDDEPDSETPDEDEAALEDLQL